MSNKDYYDEDEVIDSLVNDKTPNKNENFRNNRWQDFSGSRNMQVHHVGCGCFDIRKFLINFLI